MRLYRHTIVSHNTVIQQRTVVILLNLQSS